MDTNNNNINNVDTNANDDTDDWEEWDGNSPFWIHCLAGSIAGVVEHVAVYPLDTVRTHIQVCASCLVQQKNKKLPSSVVSTTTSSSASSLAGLGSSGGTAASRLLTQQQQQQLPTGMWQTIRYLVNEASVVPEMTTTGGRVETAAAATTTRASSTTSSSASTATFIRNPLLPWSHSTSLSTTNTTLFPPRSKDTIRGWMRLWRGVDAILLGCVPAHALYFASYETVKAATSSWSLSSSSSGGGGGGGGGTSSSLLGSSLSGIVAVFCHDIVMTPMDTIKQRMQLGHYDTAWSAFQSTFKDGGGWKTLYRSFPITMFANAPYGAVMIATNEYCKERLTTSASSARSTKRGEGKNMWSPTITNKTQIVMLSSSIAGFAASAITTPLDRIKTALQTQQLAPACPRQQQQQRRTRRQMQQQTLRSFASSAAASATTTTEECALYPYKNWSEAAMYIYRQEGIRGFFRGVVPRVLSHTPAVAISWTTYETVKSYLLSNQQQ